MIAAQGVPEWVSEGSIRKYHRAIAELNRENTNRKAAGQAVVEISEEAIKALYVKWGGLVLGESESVKGVAAGDEAAADARATDAQGKKPAPKKKAKAKDEEPGE